MPTIVLLSQLLTGLLVGAMLLIAVSLVPYWRSLPPLGFRAWFVAHSFHLGRVMVPLGMAASLSALARQLLPIAHPAGFPAAALQLAALAGVLVVYFAFNKPINDRLFSDEVLSEMGVGSLLGRWALWHWVRVGLGFVAFVAAL